MNEEILIAYMVFMHAALQGAAASMPGAEYSQVAERAWSIAYAAVHSMPEEIRQALLEKR